MSAPTRHASCVALEGRGLLILGRSGAGKSTLALELIALGATLVADDRVALERRGGALFARAPHALEGMIEARGLGILRMPFLPEAAVALALDLDAAPEGRSPPARSLTLLGAPVPLLSRSEPLRPAAIAAALRWGPPLDPDAPPP
ncbi:MAG: HPr kinase/phosphatase C-terminal domain-containing protein [Rubrimonas sp.]|uniref:HPr kinase/phosphorylase n=1 Tax=Rubrimonas sp. TaxID=2036015 RepID=UPI002FDCA52D